MPNKIQLTLGGLLIFCLITFKTIFSSDVPISSDNDKDIEQVDPYEIISDIEESAFISNAFATFNPFSIMEMIEKIETLGNYAFKKIADNTEQIQNEVDVQVDHENKECLLMINTNDLPETASLKLTVDNNIVELIYQNVQNVILHNLRGDHKDNWTNELNHGKENPKHSSTSMTVSGTSIRKFPLPQECDTENENVKATVDPESDKIYIKFPLQNKPQQLDDSNNEDTEKDSHESNDHEMKTKEVEEKNTESYESWTSFFGSSGGNKMPTKRQIPVVNFEEF